MIENDSERCEQLRKEIWDMWQETAAAVKNISGWVQNPGIFVTLKDIKNLEIQYQNLLKSLTSVYTATVTFATEECLWKQVDENLESKKKANGIETPTSNPSETENSGAHYPF